MEKVIWKDDGFEITNHQLACEIIGMDPESILEIRLSYRYGEDHFDAYFKPKNAIKYITFTPDAISGKFTMEQ